MILGASHDNLQIGCILPGWWFNNSPLEGIPAIGFTTLGGNTFLGASLPWDRNSPGSPGWGLTSMLLVSELKLAQPGYE